MLLDTELLDLSTNLEFPGFRTSISVHAVAVLRSCFTSWCFPLELLSGFFCLGWFWSVDQRDIGFPLAGPFVLVRASIGLPFLHSHTSLCFFVVKYFNLRTVRVVDFTQRKRRPTTQDLCLASHSEAGRGGGGGTWTLTLTLTSGCPGLQLLQTFIIAFYSSPIKSIPLLPLW